MMTIGMSVIEPGFSKAFCGAFFNLRIRKDPPACQEEKMTRWTAEEWYYAGNRSRWYY